MSRKGEVVKEGYLTKSPPVDKALASRKRRYFVLWSNGTFEYYSSASKRPQDYLKTVDLTYCEDMVAPITLQGRENIIRLTVQQGDKVRDYFLEADSRPEMDQWVTLLARVCGFSPVEEVEDYSISLDSSINSVSPTNLSPKRDLQIRPPIHFPPSDTAPYPPLAAIHPTPQSNRPPLPPPKPKRPLELDNQHNESAENGSMYFVLSPTGESVLADGPQAAYEEMGYDEEELNRNPPPVWKPLPQPTTSPLPSSIIYSRVEGGKIVDHPTTNNRSAPKLPHGINPEVSKPRKPVQRPNTGPRENARRTPIKPPPVPKQKQAGAPPPPTRPKPTGPPHRTSNQNPMKHILNDPSLMGKLHGKRQELYEPADAHRGSVSSSDSHDPMENYEEICFDLVGGGAVSSDEDEASPAFSRVSNMTLPPRRHNIGSEVALMQCPTADPKAQEYLSFQPSPSHSPHDSMTDLSNGDSFASVQSLSPHSQRKSLNLTENQPQLPPRGAERMREGSPRLVRKPLPPIADHTARPPIPPVHSTRPQAALHKGKSSSQEDLNKNKHAKPSGQPPRYVDAPPPVPLRNTSSREVSPVPQPPSRRDLQTPMPLPSEARSTPPQPPLRQNHQLPSVKQTLSDTVSPLPVPRRQPNASGGGQTASELGHGILAPPTRSTSVPTEDDAPPVPSRGARQIDRHHINSTPSLQRPHSIPTSTSEPQIAPRPPIRPTHVGEVNSQSPSPAWDNSVSNFKASRPRPAASNHMAGSRKPKPPISTKPPIGTKPPVSAKPQSSAKPPVGTRTNPPPVSSRKPVHVPRTDHLAREIPPALPPR